MFKSLLAILLLSISASADYTRAYQFYLNGDYVKTIKELKKSKKQYSNPDLHLLWGHSAKELGNLNEAMSAYERVLLLDESNTQARQSLEEIYKETKREALLTPNSALTNLKTSISIALGYDSNLNAMPDNDTIQEYFGTQTNVNNTSSAFTQLSTALSYTDELGEKGGWYTKYALRGLAQHNFSATLYNLRTFSIEAGAGHNTQRYNIYLPLSYHRVHYLGEDLLQQYRFHPSLFVPIGKKNMFNLNVVYSRNKYIAQTNKMKNDTTIAVEVGNYLLFDKDFISMHLKYERHTDIETFASNSLKSAQYIGAEFWTLKLGGKYAFTPKLTTLLNYRFRYGQYDDVVGTTVTTRDDNFHQLDSKLLYEWTENTNVFFVYTYTNNKSNYPMVEYNKNSAYVGMEYTY
ncbi:MAG: CDC27 family protein [Sulfurovum sp.]|nr:CDC27 family protein [Sulfurovum sp.]